MSKLEIDFNTLKYNLYEILGVLPNAEEQKIKKSFTTIIKVFHPDKNSELEEDIYSHIILAKQILLNKESRIKYDNYLINKADTYLELKAGFNKSIDSMSSDKDSSSSSLAAFNNKMDGLNRKHKYNSAIQEDDKSSVVDRFNYIKNNRDNIKIVKENIENMDEFNNKFTLGKTQGKFKEQIVEYKGEPSELSTYVIGESYTCIADLDKLYVEDSVQGSKYSSLDRAFMLQPIINASNHYKSLDDKMKDYQSQTDMLKKVDKNHNKSC